MTIYSVINNVNDGEKSHYLRNVECELMDCKVLIIFSSSGIYTFPSLRVMHKLEMFQ